jgi:hypothetical protein
MNFINKIVEYKHTTVIFSVLIFVCSLVALHNFKQVEQTIQASKDAITLSRYMAQSSDDLTNYARYYVTTNKEEWKKEFNRVLDIRNGVLEDGSGVKKAFKDRVKEHNFTKEEVDMILKAESLSNNLAKLEIEAFELVAKYKAESRVSNNYEYLQGLLTKAQEAMFGEAYKKPKKEIIDTTQIFYETVVRRMESEYERSMNIAWASIIVTNISLIVILIGTLGRNIKGERNVTSRRKTAVKVRPRSTNQR